LYNVLIFFQGHLKLSFAIDIVVLNIIVIFPIRIYGLHFQVANVLVYDAVRMVAKALDDISATADTLHIDQVIKINATGPKKLDHFTNEKQMV